MARRAFKSICVWRGRSSPLQAWPGRGWHKQKDFELEDLYNLTLLGTRSSNKMNKRVCVDLADQAYNLWLFPVPSYWTEGVLCKIITILFLQFPLALVRFSCGEVNCSANQWIQWIDFFLISAVMSYKLLTLPLPQLLEFWQYYNLTVYCLILFDIALKMDEKDQEQVSSPRQYLWFSVGCSSKQWLNVALYECRWWWWGGDLLCATGICILYYTGEN